MKEEFEEGEEVLVRNYHWEHWQKRYYIDTVESKDTGLKWYRTYAFGEEPGNHKCDFVRWSQIRKIQNSTTMKKDMSIGELAVIALKNYGLDARWEENDYGMMSVFVYYGLAKSELTQREVMVWSKRVTLDGLTFNTKDND